MITLFYQKRFLFLWLAMFLSTIASYLLLLSISSEIYRLSGSNFKGAGVFAFTWFLPVFMMRMTNRIISTNDLNLTLAGLTFSQALLSLSPLIFSKLLLWPIYFTLCVRGYIESVEKSGRLMLLKRILQAEQLELGSSIMGTSMYLGIGIGSLLGAVLMERIDLSYICIISGILASVSGLLYSQVKPDKFIPPNRLWPSWKSFFSTVKKHKLTMPVTSLVATVALFQGFHNVSRTAFAVGYLNMEPSSVSRLQLVSTSAVVLGAVFVGKFMLSSHRISKFTPQAMVLTTGCFLPLITTSSRELYGFFLYFVFIFLFEVSFTRMQNIVVTECPKEAAPSVFSGLNALMTSTMALTIVILGILADKMSFTSLCFFITICSVIFYGILTLNFTTIFAKLTDKRELLK